MLAAAVFSVPVHAAEILSTAVIRNSSTYNATELYSAYEVHLGKPVTESTAGAIAEAVRDKYRDDGYSRPGFKVADNGLKSGIIRIELIEASISGVRFEGNSGPHDARLDALFGDLPSGRVLRPEEIRNVLQQARRLPGLDINLSTVPDEIGDGAFVLNVDSAYKAVGGSITYTNRGTKQIGRDLLLARLVGNGILGRTNSVGLSLATAEDSSDYASGGLFLRAPLGAGATSLFTHASIAAVQVVSSAVVVDQDRRQFQVKISRPLPDWAGRKVTGWSAFEIDDLDVRNDGSLVREDRLRSVQPGASLSWREGVRQHLLTIEADIGLGALGSRLDNFAEPDDGRRNDFLIARLQYVDLVKLTERWSLRIDTYAQHSPHILPSVKRFKVGGGRIGRGFDAAALTGDRGLGGKLEVRRQLGGRLPVVEWLDGYVFYDIGAAWRHDVPGRESAASTGLGLTLRGTHLTGYIEVAKPLTHADADGDKEVGLFVELSGRF